jgi:hypothetical protein
VVFKKMQCEKCSYTGPEGEDHYHINVAHGVVTEVWFVSGNGYWDRELEKDEWVAQRYFYDPDAQANTKSYFTISFGDMENARLT